MSVTQYVTLLLAGVMAGVWAAVKLTDWRNARREYWVERISPSQLRGGKDDIAVVYHEQERWQFFVGKLSRSSGQWTIPVPDEAGWQTEMPEWLRGRREVVLDRIRLRAKRVQIVTESAQP